MSKKIYRGPYAGPLEPELMNQIDKSFHERNNNYWKLGAASSFPKKFRASYVNVMAEDPETGKQTKHTMGPYSKKTAQTIMTDLLSKGECSWVEEDWIR